MVIKLLGRIHGRCDGYYVNRILVLIAYLGHNSISYSSQRVS